MLCCVLCPYCCFVEVRKLLHSMCNKRQQQPMSDSDGAAREASEEGRAGAEGAEGAKGGNDCSVSGDGEAGPAGVAVGASPDIPLAATTLAAPALAAPALAAPAAERGPKQVVHDWAGMVEAILLSVKLYHAFINKAKGA